MRKEATQRTGQLLRAAALKEYPRLERIDRLVSALEDAYGLAPIQVLDLARRRERHILVPLSIFTGALAPLEALVLFLHNKKRLPFARIAQLLERDPRTVWYTHSQAAKKGARAILSPKDILVPVAVFAQRDLSVLEAVCEHLHKEGFGYREIATLLVKSPSTAWIALRRAREKRLGRGVRRG
ncbi:hypothetical protein JXB02_00040 [Candidatus Woesearchaeota archaeon]|nr:hypothetical protein [Candidatus Woesearchaeota archaeon]